MCSTTYTISQIIVFIMYVLLVLTYIERSRKQILITNIVVDILEGISFYLLNGYTGFAMSFFYIIRDVFFLNEIKNIKNSQFTKRDYIILLILLLMIVGLTIVAYDGIFSLFSVIATIITTVAIWQRNTKIYRILGILSCMFWLGYYIYIYSIVAIVLESILLIATVFGVIRETRRDTTKIISEYY